MPTYDYRCNNCRHEFELFQRMTESPRRTCPECGKKALERLIGAGAGVIFKGSGFYETDYRSESYKKGAEAEKKSGGEGKGEKKKGESSKKPDSKSDSGSPKASAPCGTGCGCAAKAVAK
jgi:putative FmdB family regulatory protein